MHLGFFDDYVQFVRHGLREYCAGLPERLARWKQAGQASPEPLAQVEQHEPLSCDIIPALAVLHNFIRIHDPSDLPDKDDDSPDYTNDDSGLQDNTDVKDTAAGF